MASADTPSADSTARGISRRTLVKGAAWSVPVIALAAPAPAFAASPCTPTTNFDGLEVGTSPTSISFFNEMGQPTGVVASLSYASNGQGGDPTPGETGQVAQTVQGWNYIELEMVRQLDQGDSVTLTLTFNQAVTGLSFIMHDIDKVQGAWTDTVVVTPGGYTSVLGTNVQGNGSAANPFNPINFGDIPITSGQNTARVTYPGSVTQVVIQYIAGATGNSANQHIGLGDLSYSLCVPAGATRQARMAIGRVPVEPYEDLSFVETDGGVDQ